MNVINGLKYLCQDSCPSPFAAPARNLRRLLWRWLHTVIGWVDVDKSGVQWDAPTLTGTDGATDAANAWLFTSATGGFTTALIGSILSVHPTDATAATTGGFADPERNGLFKIVNVLDGNTLVLSKGMGVHADGLPLSESGLHFTIDDFATSAEAPVTTEWFVLEGQHSDATPFHFRNRELYTANYGRHYFQISPYADWDAVGHAWNLSNRVSPEQSMLYEAQNVVTPEVLVYAGGDKTHFWVFAAVMRQDTGTFHDGIFFNVGEFDAFHAADLKPSVSIGYVNPTTLTPWAGIHVPAGVNADGTVPLTLAARFMCRHRDSSTGVFETPAVTLSRYSGRAMVTPVVLSSENAGYEAIRGQLKFGVGQSVTYVGQQPRVLGTAKTLLQIFNLIFAWNGSDVRQAFYGV